MNVPPKKKAREATEALSKAEQLRAVLDRKRRAEEAEAVLLDLLETVLSDGTLTSDEVALLIAKAQRSGLAPGSIERVKKKYLAGKYAEAVNDGRVTAAEDAAIKRICSTLGLPIADVVKDPQGYHRMRLLAALEEGELPAIPVRDLVLQSGEICHHQEKAWILEERVIGRYYSGDSSGWSFRICRGVTYRVGAHQGKAYSRRAVVRVDSGMISITNQRVIYAGQKKSFVVKLPKIVSVQLYRDAVSIAAEGRVKVLMVGISDPDMVGSVISAALNRS